METEITAQTIDNYVKGLINIDNCIGRLDTLRIYTNEVYGQDVMLKHTLDTISRQLIELSGQSSNMSTEQIVKQPITQIENKVMLQGVKYDINFDFTKPIVEFEFDSENLGSLKYSPYTQKAYITFRKNDEVYVHSGVPQTEILNLCNAKSAGVYYNKIFKHKYSYEKITESVG